LGCATAPERPETSGGGVPAATSTPSPDGGAAPTAAASARAGTPSAFGEVDTLLAQSLPAWGGGVLRVEQDDKVIFERAYGGYTVADAVPIASATKLLSTLVILSVVKDGTLGLDTPVRTLLPDWPKDKSAITLRMLLAQTSGLPARSPCLETRSATLAACTQEIARTPLRAAPGTAFVDGGAGFQVAGRMAELASGKPWALLIQTRLMDPLGFRSTGFGHTDNPRIAGGAQASASEYARALRQLLPGASPDLLGPELRAAVLADQSGGVPLAQSAYGLAPGRESLRAGLGVYRDRVASDGRALEVVAQGVFGFTGWVDTERRVVGVLVVRGKVSEVWPVEQRLRELVRTAVPVASR
ncbi:MAG TPA: serine hydrolase domain-containing protein, partial [Myxococcaceae bacterium]|nr:serine hydrolase domain-containing protein [Myxococcaceae bacterium]